MKENSSFKDIRIKMNKPILGGKKKKKNRWKALVAYLEDYLLEAHTHQTH